MLKNMAARLIALALGFVVMVAILPGVHRTSAGGIFWSALVYMVINATAGRLLKFVTAPLALVTLGLSILAINLVVLAITVMILRITSGQAGCRVSRRTRDRSDMIQVVRLIP